MDGETLPGINMYAILISMIKLVAFLSNNIKEYERTRHNIGKMLYSRMSGEGEFIKFHSQFKKKGSLVLLAPLSYMNTSGIAISEAFSFYKLKAEELLVVHDDSEIGFGTYRVEKGGPLRGHNGLRSVKERIGSDGFFRLRLGIGRPRYGDLRSFVISPFSKDEEKRLPLFLSEAEKALESLVAKTC